MKKTTQEQLAKKVEAEKVEAEKVLGVKSIGVDTDKKGEVTKVTTKPAAKTEEKKPKTEKKPKVDVSLADRQMFLDGLRAAGLTIESKATWHKVTGADKKRRVYVQVKGPQVHLSGFTVTGDYAVEQLTEEKAKERHLGSVRGIIWLDRNNTPALRTCLKDVLAAMK